MLMLIMYVQPVYHVTFIIIMGIIISLKKVGNARLWESG